MCAEHTNFQPYRVYIRAAKLPLLLRSLWLRLSLAGGWPCGPLGLRPAGLLCKPLACGAGKALALPLGKAEPYRGLPQGKPLVIVGRRPHYNSYCPIPSGLVGQRPTGPYTLWPLGPQGPGHKPPLAQAKLAPLLK